MKKMQKPLLVFLFALLSLTALSDDNLIKNPAFNISPGSQKPDHWRGGKMEVSAGNLPEAKAAMKIAVENKEKTKEYYRGSLSQVIGKLVPGEYELSLNFRGELAAIFAIVRDNSEDTKPDFMLRSWVPQQKFVRAANAPGWFKFYSRIIVDKELSDALFIFQGEDKKPSSFEITDIQFYQIN
jgi:hypothetical protein